jgi:hypothetical protein
MSKDRPSFSDLGSRPPPECPIREQCMSLLRAPDGVVSGEMGADLYYASEGDMGDQIMACLKLNPNRCSGGRTLLQAGKSLTKRLQDDQLPRYLRGDDINR